MLKRYSDQQRARSDILPKISEWAERPRTASMRLPRLSFLIAFSTRKKDDRPYQLRSNGHFFEWQQTANSDAFTGLLFLLERTSCFAFCKVLALQTLRIMLILIRWHSQEKVMQFQQCKRVQLVRVASIFDFLNSSFLLVASPCPLFSLHLLEL